MIISLTTLAILQAQQRQQQRAKSFPNFKNALEVMRRYFYIFLLNDFSSSQFDILYNRMLYEISRVVCKKQPGRSYPRVSMQPINPWPMAKRSKIKAHNQGRRVNLSKGMREKYQRLDKLKNQASFHAGRVLIAEIKHRIQRGFLKK